MRYALIGCGRIAINHIRACIHNRLELCGLCDLDIKKTEQLLEKTDYPHLETIHTYTDYKELIWVERPDFVSIATESGCHAEIAFFCVEQGIHVIIEKPVALSMKDADRLVSAAERKHVKICACHQNRFNPAVQALRQAIDKGRFGKISHASIHVRWNRTRDYYAQANWRGTWGNDGGALMNQCIHGIDLLRWLLGDEIEHVYGQTGQQFHHYLEAEDVGMAVVRFKNGVIATIEGTTNVYPKNLEESLYIFGEKGTVKIGGTSTNNIDIWEFADQGIEDEEKRNLKEATSNVYGNGHAALFADMVDAIENDRSPYVDAKAGRNALELVLAIYKSQKTGMPVKFPMTDFASIDMEGMFSSFYVDSTASIDDHVSIGNGTSIWHYSHLQTGARIGEFCTIGQNVNIAPDVNVGNHVKIQNNVSVYSGVVLEDYVFCGPSCVFTNDLNPRSKYPKQHTEYQKTIVKEGATIGANATIVCGHTLGRYSFVGAGAVVLEDVPDHALVAGVPGRQIGWVCECGNRLEDTFVCSHCGKSYQKTENGLKRYEENCE